MAAFSPRSSILPPTTRSPPGSGAAFRPSTCAWTITVPPCPLVARASVIKLGGTLATAEAHVFDENDKLVASGRGVYLTLTR